MNSSIRLMALSLLLGLIFTRTSVAQTIRYLKPTASGNGSGTSWANASDNLQLIISASVTGDQIWMAGGTYKPGGNNNTVRDLSFAMKAGVAIYGGFEGIETALSQRPNVNPLAGSPSSSTLSGEIGNQASTTDNSYGVIRNIASQNPGITSTAILDGFVITSGYTVGSFGDPNRNGGGMRNIGSSPTVSNVLFVNNYAQSLGGGMYNESNSNPVLTNVVFTSCTASGSGGGLYNTGSSPSLVNVSFEGNTAFTGGGIYNNASSVTVINAGFINNRNTFSPTSGAVYNFNGSSTTIVNGSFQGNTGVSDGGGLTLTNGVLWNNSNPVFTGGATVRNSLLEPSVTGYTSDPSNLTTLSASPFAGTATVVLAANSPAIDVGNNQSYTAASGPPTDLVGNPRFVGTDCQSRIIDMGAVEFQPTGPNIRTSIGFRLQPPSLLTVCAGSSVSVPVSVVGAVTNYQWFRGITPVVSQTTTTLTLPSPTTADTGTYSLVVTGACESLTSTAFSLMVKPVPARLYVAASQTANVGDGLSWQTAFRDLQQALNFTNCAQNLTEIWVATGIYRPTATTTRTFSFALRNGVAIYGGFTGSETTLSERPAINPVLGSPSIGTPTGSTLSGDIGTANVITDNSYHVIFNPASLSLNASAVLDGFVITAGRANRTGVAQDTRGAGIYNISGSPTLVNISFVRNSVTTQGGAIYNETNSNPTLTNCVLQSNTATTQGGGIYNTNSSPTLTNCLLQSNLASTQGGAIYNTGSNPTLTNCTLLSNTATTSGGAIYNTNSRPMLTNCVVWNNGGTNTLANVSSSSTTARFSLFDNTVTGYVSDPTNRTATTSPFASTTSVVLAACSPAINAGNPASITTATGPYSATALPTTDLAGSPRIVGGRVDMGAVEYQSQSGVPLGIVQQPVAGSVVCAGSSVVVSVSVTGSVSTYQWYRSGTALTGIASATTASLTLSNVQAGDQGSYSAVVSGDCPSVTSTAFSLTVNALPSVTVTASPSTTLSCASPSLTLTAQSSATALRWSTGETTTSITVSTTGLYSVTATGANSCTAVSNSLSISRDVTSPTVSVSAGNTTLTCANPSLTLTATSSATALRWSTNETTTSISVSTTGLYSVTATGANGCTAVSNSLSISQDLTLFSFSVNSVTVCQGQTFSLLASGCSGQVVWSTGTTGSSLTVTAGSSNSLLTATCTVGSCSTTASGRVVVGQVLPPPAQILSLRADESVCPVRLLGQGVGTSFVFTNARGYVFSYVYRQSGTYAVTGPSVTQPGVYTLTAINTNECGSSAPVSQTVTVSRSCP